MVQKQSDSRTLIYEVGSEPLIEVERQVFNPDDLQPPSHALDCVGDVTG